MARYNLRKFCVFCNVVGGVISPILANIFAHHVIDIWFQDTVKKHCRGKVEMFRYADGTPVQA